MPTYEDGEIKEENKYANIMKMSFKICPNIRLVKFCEKQKNKQDGG